MQTQRIIFPVTRQISELRTMLLNNNQMSENTRQDIEKKFSLLIELIDIPLVSFDEIVGLRKCRIVAKFEEAVSYGLFKGDYYDGYVESILRLYKVIICTSRLLFAFCVISITCILITASYSFISYGYGRIQLYYISLALSLLVFPISFLNMASTTIRWEQRYREQECYIKSLRFLLRLTLDIKDQDRILGDFDMMSEKVREENGERAAKLFYTVLVLKNLAPLAGILMRRIGSAGLLLFLGPKAVDIITKLLGK